MAVDQSKTNETGDTILISIQEPYKNVVEILGYADETVGETTDVFYTKSFRWGIDGVTYSDWISLTNESLKGLLLTPINPFWIQYKYEHVGDGTLEFKSIALEIVTDGGIIKKVPQLKCFDNDSMMGSQNLIIDCCGSSWNPYDLSKASQMYNQLSAITSNLFGFCVKYFKTASDQRSKDVILKEYSLFNVIATSEVKILLPDNELPTREIQFNPLMMDFPVQFEIHIVKSAFQKVFGIGSKPQERDYLYFEQFMNRMYEVDAVAEADDFLYTGSYWRVSLVPYQQRTSVLFSDKNIEEEKDSIVSNIEEKFKEERNNEFDDVRKPNQYNTIGTLSDDYVRRILDKKLLIKEENIYNNWTIISKDNYQLRTIDKFAEAVKYRYDKGWAITDNRAFTFWLRPTYNNPIGENIIIKNIVNSGGKVKLLTDGIPTGSNGINVGDWVNISGTASYNGLHKVISVGTTGIDINTQYVDDIKQANPRFFKESSNQFMVYTNKEDSTNNLVSFTHTPNWFILEINDAIFKYNLKLQQINFIKDKWYAITINLNSLANQLSLFVYETVQKTASASPNLNSTLHKVFSETKTYIPSNVEDNNSWRLLGCDLDITNIRIWKNPIEEELQELLLSQYVVKDTHLALLLDNASPRLLLPKETNPR